MSAHTGKSKDIESVIPEDGLHISLGRSRNGFILDKWMTGRATGKLQRERTRNDNCVKN
jgi:hypothetical protein